MKKYIAIIAALAFILPSQARRRPLNEEKTINEIWARTDMPEFNEFTLDDKYKDEPVIFLARYDEFIGKERAIVTGNILPITIKKLSRYLVKINDNSAIKSFSEIEYKNYSQQYKSVVGIRIHKQDGTLVELNPNDYIKVSTNLKSKKTKSNVSKIAVPNLQKGDIVDYFIYQEIDLLFSEQFEYPISGFAPIQKYRFHGEFNTMQKSWYWLPKSIKATESTNNGTDLLDFKLTDIAKREKQSFNAPYRDEPRLKLAFAKYISPCKKSPIEKELKSLNRMTKETTPNRVNDIINNYAGIYSKAPTLSWLYRRAYKNIQSALKKHLAETPNMPDKQKADEIYNYLCFASRTQGITLDTKSFWQFFSDLTSSFGITHMQGCVYDRYSGEWESHLFDSDYDFTLRINDGTYYYPVSSLTPCAIDKPSIYEGMEAIMVNAGNKTMKYKACKDYNKLVHKKINVTPAEKNRYEYAINVALDKSDANALDIDRTVSVFGSHKSDIRDNLGTLHDWDSIMRIHFKIQENFEEDAKKNGMTAEKISQYKSYFAQESHNQRKDFEKEAKEYFANHVDTVSTYTIKSYGLFSDKPAFIYSSSTKVGELVKSTPDCKIISVGRLIKDLDFSSLKKERKSDVAIKSTSQTIYKITLDIPTGYKVEDLSQLQSNVSNSCGAFASNAKVENNKLVLSVDWKINNVEFPAQEWSKLLEIFNAYEAFFNKSAVLSR